MYHILKNERGSAAMEYTLMVGFIGLVLASVLLAFGPNLQKVFSSLDGRFNTVQTSDDSGKSKFWKVVGFGKFLVFTVTGWESGSWCQVIRNCRFVSFFTSQIYECPRFELRRRSLPAILKQSSNWVLRFFPIHELTQRSLESSNNSFCRKNSIFTVGFWE